VVRRAERVEPSGRRPLGVHLGGALAGGRDAPLSDRPAPRSADSASAPLAPCLQDLLGRLLEVVRLVEPRCVAPHQVALQGRQLGRGPIQLHQPRQVQLRALHLADHLLDGERVEVDA